MERGEASVPEWRDRAAYAPLLAADPAILAWEWLRRDPRYRAAAAAGGATSAPAWGLHRFEDPALAAPLARPPWTATAFEEVLIARVEPAAGEGALDLSRMTSLLTIVPDPDGQRLLFSDGWRIVRLDLVGCSALEQPVRLIFSVPGPPRLSSALLALRRFERLERRGAFARPLGAPGARAERRLLQLRTADALAAGASQRDIAADLLDPGAGRPGWREERPDLRLRAQRLVRDARARQAGGYRKLLRGT